MAKTAPRVSVLMAVYNASRFLREAVDSIVNQTFTDFELVVVDDGSTDGSFGVLATCPDDRIRLIRADHTGLTGALNAGLAACKGDLIARMDADDIADVGRLAAQVRYFDQHPEVHIVCSDVLTIDAEGSLTGRVVMKGLNNDVLRDGLLYKRVIKPIVHPTVMMRRAVVERLRGYRDFRCAEDHDFWLRAVDAFVVRRLNCFLLKYRLHDGSVSSARISRSATSACMSALSYRVRAATGIDVFDSRPDLFRLLEREAQKRIESTVLPALDRFQTARDRIRSGSVLSGVLHLGAGLARHGRLVFPAAATRALDRIVGELTMFAERRLAEDRTSPRLGCS